MNNHLIQPSTKRYMRRWQYWAAAVPMLALLAVDGVLGALWRVLTAVATALDQLRVKTGRGLDAIVRYAIGPNPTRRRRY